ncbi:tetratricopeptide repeat-containing sensor histidine kinase [Myroides sp. LJL119]
MFRNILIVFFILWFQAKTQAQDLIALDQQKYFDQIQKNIQTNTNDSIRLLNYLLLSEYLAPLDSIKSKEALHKVLHTGKKDILVKGTIQYYQGVYYQNQNNIKKAINNYTKAIELFSSSQVKSPLLIKAHYNNAYIQVQDKGYDFMVQTLTNYCIPLSIELKNSELLAYSYTQLGLTFMSVGQFKTAQEYHNKALEELEKLPRLNSVHLLTFLNLVSNYCYMPDSKTAKVYLDKAKELIKDYPDSPHYTNYHYQEAMYYTTIQDFDNALRTLEKGVRLAKQKKQPKQLNLLYFRMYNVFLMQKNYVKAKELLEHILQENILSKEAFNRRVTYTQLAGVNNILGNSQQAYEWMKKSAALGDSLQQSKILEKMNELDVLLQSTTKQRKIDQLELQTKENELINQSKNMRITLLTTALLLCFIIMFLVYRNYKKQIQLNQQIHINHQQELVSIENQRKFQASQAILQGEEQERQRIAQDLHDSMGGMLANIRMTLSAKNNIDDFPILEKIDKSIAEMRRISRNLMPETLKNLGLEVTLKELCQSMSQKDFHIQFEAFNLFNDIDFKVQLTLYRITQESISNIIKYARAKNVIVQISQTNNIVNLTIEDDGIGFNKDKVKYGLGLINIKNRTALINGKVDIISQPGQGTTINIECNV